MILQRRGRQQRLRLFSDGFVSPSITGLTPHLPVAKKAPSLIVLLVLSIVIVIAHYALVSVSASVSSSSSFTPPLPFPSYPSYHPYCSYPSGMSYSSSPSSSSSSSPSSSSSSSSLSSSSSRSIPPLQSPSRNSNLGGIIYSCIVHVLVIVRHGSITLWNEKMICWDGFWSSLSSDNKNTTIWDCDDFVTGMYLPTYEEGNKEEEEEEEEE